MKTRSIQLAQILSMLIIAALAFSALGVSPVRAAGILYAKLNGTGNCSSWANACTLQSALTNAVSSDEIWVAAGLHRPTSNPADRAATFQLKSGVAVYGGFVGIEIARGQRNPAANVTILSGDLLGNDNNYVMPDEPTRAENSYHVVTGANGATLDGFTVTAGQANGSVSPNNRGGGIYNSGSSPTLANIILSVNLATDSGGGMHNASGSNPSLSNVTFDGNTCSEDGGGMSNYSSSPILMNVTFSENGGYQGGGMSNAYGSHPTLTNVIFSNNSAYDGSGMFNYGSDSSYSVLTNVTFSSNTGVNGAMFNYSNSPTLTNVTFTSNAHTVGGAIYNIVGSNPQLTNVTFINNSANMGGGIYNASASNPILTNVTFKNNTAVYDGGGISNHSMGNPQIRNTIFWGNSAPDGAQIYNQSTVPPASSTVNDSILQGGCPTGSTCTNIITSDPKLGVFGNYGGFTQTIPLLTGSSAIDTGNDNVCPATDQRGITRPQGPHCDIGAFEVAPSLPPQPHIISGNVGVLGATLSYTDGTFKTTTADGAGNYSFTVSYNWSGTVTPSKVGYTFTPPSRTYTNVATDQTGQNYTATLITYTITGNVGIAGANLSYTYGTPQTAVTDGSGDYSITVPYGWSGTITPWKSGYGFTPPNRTYSNVTSDQGRQDFTTSGCDTTDVTIAGALSSSACLASGQSTRQNYNANNGPVQIVNTGTANVIAAERVNYFVGSTVTSYSEMMGLPDGQLDTTYWFPWYKNDSQISTQIRIGNVSGSTATVHISIAGAEVTGSPYTLTTTGNGQSMRLEYAANNGPVKIWSDQNIVATERVNFFVSSTVASYTEMMGLPNSQLDTTYWFPWYKNVGDGTDTQLRIGNVSGSTATVHIYIAGAEVAGSPYTLTTTGDTQSMRLSYTANNGPVKIVSDQNIVASERVNYFVDGVVTSYSEMMGQPNSQLDTTYWFPWYKNVGDGIDTQIRIGNVSGSEAHVHVYIGTAEMPGSPFTLTTTGSTQSMRLSFTANDGPVKIVSDQNIVATERVNFFVGGKVASYSEMMGLPNIQLDTAYWFPWYKNVGDGIDTQLRFGIP